MVLIRYERHPRARRYRLTWLRDGTARCTLPARGTLAEARRFVERCHKWLAGRMRLHASSPARNAPWDLGTHVWFRGTDVALERHPDGTRLQLGELAIDPPPPTGADLRFHVETALFRLAIAELPARLSELAQAHALTVRRVSVRNQRSRWGSCSRRGTVSLNWRLVQVPIAVRDYIILHELAHLRHLNHSARFWAEVARLCPDYEVAERWLREHGRQLI